MNRRILLLFTAITILLLMTVEMSLGSLHRSELDKQLENMASSVWQSRSDLVASNVRGDLLIGNIRGATVKLESYRQKDYYSAFQIYKKEKLLFESGPTKPGTKTRAVSYPIFFSGDQQGPSWGKLRLFYRVNELDSISAQFLTSSWRTTVFAALAIFVVLGFGFYLLNQSVREIGKLLTAYQSDSVVPDTSAQTLKLWHPLLATLKSSSEKFHATRKQLEESRVYETIAKTTQMVAHDVRKPFSLVEAILGMIESEDDPQKVKEIATHYAPEVNKAILSVNGLLADVMEVGSRNSIEIKTIDPAQLIQEAQRTTFQYIKNIEIEFLFDFKHTLNPKANFEKMQRVLSNILTNASQAMNGSGKIWFKTRDKGHFVEFCIGNTGSYISPEEIQTIFDSFYTKGKPNGIGLGLAICKKIIESHGGEIWCQSTKTTGVEFYFTLPASE